MRVVLEGVVNFRDFGGQQLADGRRVRTGVLFRSGHHGSVTEKDLDLLAQLDFALVVDLRRAAERRREVSRRPLSFRAKVLEHAAPPTDALAPHLTFLAVPDATPEMVTERMTSGYRNYPFDPHYVALYRDYFAELPHLDGRVLIHCHAGKDRTGVLCALTLHALGVSREDIFEDYLLTNRHSRTDARVDQMRAAFSRNHGKPVDEDLLRHTMKAQSVYLEAAFGAMEAEYGSLDAYLADHVGLTPEAKSAMRERLLV